MQRGFTLIETAIAMALLAFVVGDVALVALYASRSGSQAQQLTGAVTVAENAIEYARGADFNKLKLTDNPSAQCFTAARIATACGGATADIVRECFTPRLEAAACGSPGSLYTRERIITTPGGAPLDSVRSAQVEATVAWVNARGAAEEFRLATIVSKF